MPRVTLAERMSRLAQQKARLAEEEARIKDQERKQRTRRLIEAGTLVEKADLLNLSPATLLGALLGLKTSAATPESLARWTADGEKLLAREAAERDRQREPLIVSFKGDRQKDFATELRALGLRWNKVLQHWEGLSEIEPVTTLARRHGGEVRRARPERSVEAAE